MKYEHVELLAMPEYRFESVYRQMGDVVSSATRDRGDNDWATSDWEARRGRLVAGTEAYLVWDGNTLAGFTIYRAFDYEGRNCVHMQSAYIRPEYQRRGIGFSVAVRVTYRSLFPYPWREILIVVDMLNPIVLSGWMARQPPGMKAFPSELGQHSDYLDSIAPRVAADLFSWAKYDPELSVLHERTSPRSAAVAKSGNEALDRMFAERVNPATGDTFLALSLYDRSVVLSGLKAVLQSTRRGLDRRLRPKGDTRQGSPRTDSA